MLDFRWFRCRGHRTELTDLAGRWCWEVQVSQIKWISWLVCILYTVYCSKFFVLSLVFPRSQSFRGEFGFDSCFVPNSFWSHFSLWKVIETEVVKYHLHPFAQKFNHWFHIQLFWANAGNFQHLFLTCLKIRKNEGTNYLMNKNYLIGHLRRNHTNLSSTESIFMGYFLRNTHDVWRWQSGEMVNICQMGVRETQRSDADSTFHELWQETKMETKRLILTQKEMCQRRTGRQTPTHWAQNGKKWNKKRKCRGHRSETVVTGDRSLLLFGSCPSCPPVWLSWMVCPDGCGLPCQPSGTANPPQFSYCISGFAKLSRLRGSKTPSPSPMHLQSFCTLLLSCFCCWGCQYFLTRLARDVK